MILFSEESLAQDQGGWHPVFRNYSTVDGLPSMEVYCSVQDSDGYMWFATDRGVVRFNGEEFHSYTTRDGLESNAVFKISIDDENRIWFLSDTPRLCYWEKGEIKSYKFNNKLEEALSNEAISYYTSWNFSNNEVMFSASKNNPIKIDANGIVTHIPPPELDGNPLNRYYVYSSYGKIVLSKDYGVISFETGDLVSEKRLKKAFNEKLQIRIVTNEINETIECLYRESYRICTGVIGRDIVYLTDRRSIYLIWNGGWINKSFEKNIASVSVINDFLWIGYIGGGVKQFKVVENELVEISHLFSNKSISSVYEDDIGSLWFTSLNNGVFIVGNLGLSKLMGIPEIEGTLLDLTKFENSLLIINEKRKFFRLDVDFLKLKEIGKGKGGQYSLPFIPDSKKVFVNTTFNNHYDLCEFKNNKLEVLYNYSAPLSMRKTGDGSLITGSTSRIEILGNKRKTFLLPIITRGIELKDSENVWVANHESLKIFNFTTGKSLDPEEKILNQRVNDVLAVGRNVFFATNGNGLLIKNENGIDQITENDGLPYSFLTKIKKGKDGVIWLLSNKGIAKMITDENGNYSFESYDATLFHCEKMHDFYPDEDYIYITTNKGLVRLENNSSLSSSHLPRLYLTSIESDGKNIKTGSHTTLNYSQKLLINFDGVYYGMNDLLYRYRSNTNEDWIITKEKSIRFALLPSGDYQFEIQASINGEDWTDSEKFDFTILPPFWWTWWFISLEVLLGGIVVVWFVKIRLIIVNRKHAEKEKMMELQQEALTQQMNPHFIFNALGSVQNSILKGDSKQANSYLVKFSRLLRSGLNASRSRLITLEDDKELMENYLAVEKTRLGDSFTFNVEIISESENYSLYISPFLLQPFIENSIKHGIGEHHQAGHVNVTYLEKERCIECTIEDNGIGRDAANNTKLPSHVSHGIKIAFERIELFNKSRGHSYEKKIEDLFDEKNNSRGTRVIFTVPLILK